jgi:hypothetical protein
MIKKFALGILSLSLISFSANAANLADDNAANSPYDDGWQTLDNGGTGFGAWTLNGPGDANGAHGGFFMGSSSGNAGGSSGNIDTAGRSWGMFANTSQTVSAIRPLTGGSLLVGQMITLKIDNGFLNNPSSEGFGLQTSGGSNRLEFFFNGGDSDYTIANSTGNHDTGIGFTGNGLSFAFTLTGTNTYSLDVTPNGGGTTNFTGTLEGVAGTGIDQMRFFDFNGGNGQTGGNGDFFANSLEVVPEPSTWLAGAMTLGGCFYLRRRRKA